jgi:hypothetical protein
MGDCGAPVEGVQLRLVNSVCYRFKGSGDALAVSATTRIRIPWARHALATWLTKVVFPVEKAPVMRILPSILVIYGALSRSASRRRCRRPDRPNPVKGGKRGSKLHVLIDRPGLPLAEAGQHCKTHDRLALIPLVQAIGAIRWMWAPDGTGRLASPS